MNLLAFVWVVLVGTSKLINAHVVSCGELKLPGISGIITSPGYPMHYKSGLSCHWIIPTPPNTTLQLKFHDLNLDLDSDCSNKAPHSSCCKKNYVSVPAPGGVGTRHYCGDAVNLIKYDFYSVAPHARETTIKFKTSFSSLKRGFRLEYRLVNSSSCDPSQFQCGNGACLENKFRCDNKADCADKSDEHNCYEWCQSQGKVMCGIYPDVQCYDNRTQACDSVADCDNMKDEKHCHTGTLPVVLSLQCGSGETYTKEQHCNGVLDCKDGSDEMHCSICKSIKGEPIGLDKRCDDHIDCVDGLDELGCHRECSASIRCITKRNECFLVSQRCDGRFDCEDGSDEWMCPDSMLESLSQACPRSSDKRCSNSQCIPNDMWCNGRLDCADGSDEENCDLISAHTECPREEDRRCNNLACIPRSCWCNGIDECGDASDEEDCLRNSIIAAAIMAALLCALLVVIAVGCTCRLYNLRMMYAHGFVHPPPLSLRHRLAQNSLTLPSMLDDEFYHPEPPPAYSVAVGECPPPPTSIASHPSNGLPGTHQAPPRRHRRLGSSRRVRPPHCSSLTPLVESSPTTSQRVLISSSSPEVASPADNKSDDETSGHFVYSDDSELLSL
ncbi:hypothetical protein M8J75_005072 [Diaphorina citri]|nr:hypothetical protein M8J75_005072 [Diaphorina citri]